MFRTFLICFCCNLILATPLPTQLPATLFLIHTSIFFFNLSRYPIHLSELFQIFRALEQHDFFYFSVLQIFKTYNLFSSTDACTDDWFLMLLIL